MKDSIALDFMIEVLNVVKAEKGSASVLNLLKKSGMDTQVGTRAAPLLVAYIATYGR